MTVYLIRRGWNAANQSSRGAKANPKNSFESREYALIDIVESDSVEDAEKSCTASCYNNQSIFGVTNPREIAGLTEAIRNFHS